MNFIQVKKGDYKLEHGKFSLKELRARKNETQEQVAKNIGISPQTYNAWEKDISNVAVSKVQALAKYFGVSLEDIFFTY